MLQISEHLWFILHPDNRADTLSWIEQKLKNKNFDSIVVCGMSGLLVVPVADKLGKNIVIIRKESDKCHSHYNIEGSFPKRYIIIDDLIGSGNTISRMYTMTQKYSSCNKQERAKCVGIILYHHYNYNKETFFTQNLFNRVYPGLTNIRIEK